MTNSLCSTCRTRPVDTRNHSGTRRGKCRECYRDYMRRYMQRRRQIRPDDAQSAAARLALKQHLASLTPTGGVCADCGWTPDRPEAWAALEFHHVDPAQKAFGICGSHTRARWRLEAEARKCVMLCANCHRIGRTARLTPEEIALSLLLR